MEGYQSRSGRGREGGKVQRIRVITLDTAGWAGVGFRGELGRR